MPADPTPDLERLLERLAALAEFVEEMPASTVIGGSVRNDLLHRVAGVAEGLPPAPKGGRWGAFLARMLARRPAPRVAPSSFPPPARR